MLNTKLLGLFAFLAVALTASTSTGIRSSTVQMSDHTAFVASDDAATGLSLTPDDEGGESFLTPDDEGGESFLTPDDEGGESFSSPLFDCMVKPN